MTNAAAELGALGGSNRFSYRMTSRHKLAWLVAPLIGVIVVWAGAILASARHFGPLPNGSASHTFFFFMFFELRRVLWTES